MKHEALTHQIIGLAMKVHSTLGMGFQEVIYQRCLKIEFDKDEVPYVLRVRRWEHVAWIFLSIGKLWWR
ncbi:GxxExxY protein [Gracilimonas mengyeensis]|uniref:GxxExxY protein n=1 Tax=Gracilimonas mengyeensis TaxID=1302730 RepID=A0A521DGT2_9BACT|nr:GxxExxY protein [Gracilimonas mengyeensis]